MKAAIAVIPVLVLAWHVRPDQAPEPVVGLPTERRAAPMPDVVVPDPPPTSRWERDKGRLPCQIRVLAREIEGLEDYQIYDLVRERYGEPHRTGGSGIWYTEWDIAGGTLQVVVGAGDVTFRYPGAWPRSAQSVSLFRTYPPAKRRVTLGMELYTIADTAMGRWVGSVQVDLHQRYHFRPASGTYPSSPRQPPLAFFARNPTGTVRIEYADGLSPETTLEDLEDGTKVATITYIAEDDREELAFEYWFPTGLRYVGKEPLPFNFQ